MGVNNPHLNLHSLFQGLTTVDHPVPIILLCHTKPGRFAGLMTQHNVHLNEKICLLSFTSEYLRISESMSK